MRRVEIEAGARASERAQAVLELDEPRGGFHPAGLRVDALHDAAGRERLGAAERGRSPPQGWAERQRQP